jgi:hypothetical protein
MEIRLKYSSIAANKSAEPSGHVEITNNSTLTKVDAAAGGISVGFSFTSTYAPNVGEIRITGDVTVTGPEENIAEALRQWEASGRKDLPVGIAEDIHNLILFNCVTEATLMAKEIQLPPPMPMPRVSISDKPKQKEDTGNYIR